MQETTLCLVIANKPEQCLLLGMKKRGFGQGKYNGFGGKIRPGETSKAAALRELKEESGLIAQEDDLEEVGYIDFFFSGSPELDHPVYIYLVRNWQGEPCESEEMKPQWFTFSEIPYSQMWQDDQYWLPAVLQGHNINGIVTFSENQEIIESMEWKIED